MKRFLIIIALIISFQSAKSQYNDSTFHHVTLSSTGSINKTNDDKAYLLNNSLSWGVKRNDIVLNSSNTWLYGKQNGTLSNNDFSSSLNFNLYKTLPHFYYWGLLNYNTSYSLKVKNQFLGGLGVAYSFLDKDDAYLNISDGVLYDKSSLVEGENYNTYRNSLRLNYYFEFKGLLSISGNHFLQSSFSRKNDYIIRSSTTLGLKLKKWISLTASLNYNKMNVTHSENLNFTYGLILDKYF